MFDSHSPQHAAYIQRETLTGCVFNAILSVVFAFVVFRGRSPILLWGTDGLAVDLVPTVFMITLVGNVIVTLITRRRVASGQVPAMPVLSNRFVLFRQMLPRILIAAFLMTIVLVPLSVLALWAIGIDRMDFGPFVAFKVVYGAAVGALSAPWVIRHALSDAPVRPAQTPER